jgi:hypothetical protein
MEDIKKSRREYQRKYSYKNREQQLLRCVSITIKVMKLYKNIKENII